VDAPGGVSYFVRDEEVVKIILPRIAVHMAAQL
jgi:hypothetical protein